MFIISDHPVKGVHRDFVKLQQQKHGFLFIIP